MQGNDLDQLFQSRISTAKSGRKFAAVIVALLIIALLGGTVFAVTRLLKKNTDPDPQPTGPQENPVSTPSDLIIPPDQNPDDTQPPDSTPGSDTPTGRKVYSHTIRLTWETEELPSEPMRLQILWNEEVQAECELTAENGWCYTWEDEHPAEEIHFLGIFPQGAAASFLLDGEDFAITAAYFPPEHSGEGTGGEQPGDDETQENTELPQTGIVWWPAALLFVSGAGCILLSKKRHYD
ncbi:MAG: hypothetical protein ACSW8F_00285 [bacterium]